MTDEHHSWIHGGNLPSIRPHSVAKHRVTENYLRRYVEVLTSNQRIPAFRLTLVDGFAGGGLYRDEITGEQCFGSPLRMMRAMSEAKALSQIGRKKEFNLDVEYLFIDKSFEHLSCLKASIESSEYRDLIQKDKVKLINGEFVDHVDAIVTRIKERRRGCRAIFVLDQFGYAAVPFPIIRKMLTGLSKAEIILTFATDSLINYLSTSDQTQKLLANLGLELSKDKIRTSKQRADWRFAIQHFLHKEIFLKSGAKYYTPFFIRSKDANRDYWLIHLSNHSRARDVMVGLHWSEKSTFSHFGRPGLEMLGYDPDLDSKITGQAYLFDDSAENSTIDSLMSELPERLHRYPAEGVMFKQLFADITNETPATSDILKRGIAVLLEEGHLEVRDATGLTQRQAGVQHDTDVIKPMKQRKLFLPPGFSLND